MDDLDKYVLEQAKIEVEHTRSWPTKILAFYVAIIAGIVTAVFSITSRAQSPLYVPWCIKVLLTVAIAVLLLWAFVLLQKNHRSYLRYRNMQIRFQKSNQEELQKRFTPPPEWFLENEVSLETRGLGWAFYFYLIVLVTALGLTGIWIS